MWQRGRSGILEVGRTRATFLSLDLQPDLSAAERCCDFMLRVAAPACCSFHFFTLCFVLLRSVKAINLVPQIWRM